MNYTFKSKLNLLSILTASFTIIGVLIFSLGVTNTAEAATCQEITGDPDCDVQPPRPSVSCDFEIDFGDSSAAGPFNLGERLDLKISSCPARSNWSEPAGSDGLCLYSYRQTVRANAFSDSWITNNVRYFNPSSGYSGIGGHSYFNKFALLKDLTAFNTSTRKYEDLKNFYDASKYSSIEPGSYIDTRSPLPIPSFTLDTVSSDGKYYYRDLDDIILDRTGTHTIQARTHLVTTRALVEDPSGPPGKNCYGDLVSWTSEPEIDSINILVLPYDRNIQVEVIDGRDNSIYDIPLASDISWQISESGSGSVYRGNKNGNVTIPSYSDGRDIKLSVLSLEDENFSNYYIRNTDNSSDTFRLFAPTIANYSTGALSTTPPPKFQIVLGVDCADCPPPPTLDLSLDLSGGGAFEKGDDVNFTWSSTNADRCYGSWAAGAIGVSGSGTEPNVMSSRTLKLTCENNNGATATATADIVVADTNTAGVVIGAAGTTLEFTFDIVVEDADEDPNLFKRFNITKNGSYIGQTESIKARRDSEPRSESDGQESKNIPDLRPGDEIAFSLVDKSSSYEFKDILVNGASATKYIVTGEESASLDKWYSFIIPPVYAQAAVIDVVAVFGGSDTSTFTIQNNGCPMSGFNFATYDLVDLATGTRIANNEALTASPKIHNYTFSGTADIEANVSPPSGYTASISPSSASVPSGTNRTFTISCNSSSGSGSYNLIVKPTTLTVNGVVGPSDPVSFSIEPTATADFAEDIKILIEPQIGNLLNPSAYSFSQNDFNLWCAAGSCETMNVEFILRERTTPGPKVFRVRGTSDSGVVEEVDIVFNVLNNADGSVIEF